MRRFLAMPGDSEVMPREVWIDWSIDDEGDVEMEDADTSYAGGLKRDPIRYILDPSYDVADDRSPAPAFDRED